MAASRTLTGLRVLEEEGIAMGLVLRVFEVLLDVISAILDNNTLFVEPYVSYSNCSLLRS